MIKIADKKIALLKDAKQLHQSYIKAIVID